jgi:hypothetical protein
VTRRIEEIRKTKRDLKNIGRKGARNVVKK